MQETHHVDLDLDVINNNHTPGVSPPYLMCAEIKNTVFLGRRQLEILLSHHWIHTSNWQNPAGVHSQRCFSERSNASRLPS